MLCLYLLLPLLLLFWFLLRLLLIENSSFVCKSNDKVNVLFIIIVLVNVYGNLFTLYLLFGFLDIFKLLILLFNKDRINYSFDNFIIIVNLVVLIEATHNVLLFLNEFRESFFVHICHQLLKYFRIIQSHVLKELRQLIYWNAYNITKTVCYEYLLDIVIILILFTLLVGVILLWLHVLYWIHNILHFFIRLTIELIVHVILLIWLLLMSDGWMVWKLHLSVFFKFFLFSFLHFSNNARYQKSKWNQNYEDCYNNDNCHTTSHTTLWTRRRIGVVVNIDVIALVNYKIIYVLYYYH